MLEGPSRLLLCMTEKPEKNAATMGKRWLSWLGGSWGSKWRWIDKSSAARGSSDDLVELWGQFRAGIQKLNSSSHGSFSVKKAETYTAV